MVKNLQCLKTSQIYYLRHAEHHAKNRTSVRGLYHDTLFFWMNHYLISDVVQVRREVPPAAGVDFPIIVARISAAKEITIK